MTRYTLQYRVFNLLEPGLGNDKLSKAIDFVIMGLVTMTVLAVILESVESIGGRYGAFFADVETITLSIFTLEYLLRFWCAPLKYPEMSAGKARVKYFFSFYGMVDLLAISPIILAFVFPNLDLVIVRVLRLMRFVKITQYNNALQDLFEAVYHERRSFFSAAYIFVLALLLSASLAYFAENEAQPEKFSSIPEAMWWSIITLTTVGYGDVSPVTAMGKVVGAGTALLGVCSVALLTGIVANAFSAQLARKRAVFENAILRALQDGVISSSERDYLHRIRDEFNLTREYADAVFEKYVKDYGDRKIKQPNIDD